ncbi:unnamed protein product [Paramecium sonneborni]|uniref:Tetratricopeptide repeat protein n=1 Tax=Paramecium sonneborni TaxID=65129 RepID=A0A8S1PZ94_9CILI|nr:unnamed protein product [Paramecium sonneborni]
MQFINYSIQNNPEDFRNFIIKGQIKFHLIAKILKATQKFEDALMSLDDAIKINPSSFHAYDEKCLTLIQMGRLDEALENIDIAIQNEPENFFLFNNKAFILHCQGHFEQAISNLEHAIQLCPEISIFQKNKQYLEQQQCTPNSEQLILENLQLLINKSCQTIQHIQPIEQFQFEILDQSKYSLGSQFLHLGHK